ncbi:MAG: hypothetical protein KQH83_12085 [Actinobacteria bacterium]|nr:hypothetical protein [Actinomycetota bacterium]
MPGFRHAVRPYRAIRFDEGWRLEIDGVPASTHRTFSDAAAAAGMDDRRRRRVRTVARHLLLIAVASALLVPVTLGREVDNPDYPPARAFADEMEAAYRAVDAGADIASVDGDVAGGTFTVDRGGVVADYHVLTGSHDGDCYVLRWVRFEVPFVARLLPRYECVPGQPALSFSPSGFEAIAVNLQSSGPLNWEGVLPPTVALAPWFFPAMLVLLVLILQQLVAISMRFLKPEPVVKVPVERVEAG